MKTLSNFISSLIFQIVSTLVGFIVMQLILNKYGASIFGFSTSISQFGICINILEAGIGSTLIQALYNPLYNNNINGINSILTKTRRYFIKSGVFIIVLSAIVALVYSLSAKSHVSLLTLIPLSFIMLTGAILEYIFIGRYRVLLTADKRVGVLINIQTIALMISAFIKVVMMMLGFGIVSMMFTATLVYVSRILVIRAYIKFNYPNANYNHNSTEAVKIDNFAVIIQNLSNIAVINIPFIILYIFTDMNKVSIYAIYALIFNAVLSILTNVFMQAAIASFGHISASNDYDELTKKNNLFETIFISVMSTFYIATAVLMLPFVSLYTKTITGISYKDPTLVVLLTVYGIIYSLRVPALTLIFATGYFKDTLKGAIIEFIILVSLSSLLTKIFGFYGLFIGLICSAIYRTIDIIVISYKKVLNDSIKKIVRIIAINFVFIIVCALILNIPAEYSYHSWFSLIIYASLITLIALILSLLINIKLYADKSQISFIIKNLMKRK